MGPGRKPSLKNGAILCFNECRTSDGGSVRLRNRKAKLLPVSEESAQVLLKWGSVQRSIGPVIRVHYRHRHDRCIKMDHDTELFFKRDAICVGLSIA